MGDDIGGQAADILLTEQVVAYHPSIARAVGSVPAAVLASQFLFLSKAHADTEGWFYHGQDVILKETGLSPDAQQTARKLLIKLGLLEEKRRGTPARLYYRISVNRFKGRIARFGGSPNLDSSDSSSGVGSDSRIGGSPNLLHKENDKEIEKEKQTRAPRATAVLPPARLTELGAAFERHGLPVRTFDPNGVEGHAAYRVLAVLTTDEAAACFAWYRARGSEYEQKNLSFALLARNGEALARNWQADHERWESERGAGQGRNGARAGGNGAGGRRTEAYDSPDRKFIRAAEARNRERLERAVDERATSGESDSDDGADLDLSIADLFAGRTSTGKRAPGQLAGEQPPDGAHRARA